ncbi:hypothetical protein JCM10207_009089 [Rhodosporidiobolus poonsookiae]
MRIYQCLYNTSSRESDLQPALAFPAPFLLRHPRSKGLDILYGTLYRLFNIHYHGGVLRANDKELRRMEAEQSDEERLAGLRSPVRIVTLLGLGTVAAAIVVAWALYWTYSV